VAGTKQRGNDTCGSSDDLALKVEVCAKPLMDILEGKVEKYPQNDNDLLLLCNSVCIATECLSLQAQKLDLTKTPPTVPSVGKVHSRFGQEMRKGRSEDNYFHAGQLGSASQKARVHQTEVSRHLEDYYMY